MCGVAANVEEVASRALAKQNQQVREVQESNFFCLYHDLCHSPTSPCDSGTFYDMAGYKLWTTGFMEVKETK